ncbi:MAG: hypothetical protein M3P27_00060 [Acidobacteriota bacterium]|nr:hypothetical protein [Acidobacteriota bacterium]
MSNILSSWKEIALYVGRSVRTVQRWEREIGLPVHRPNAKSEGVVVALPAELDAWVRSMPTSAQLDGDGVHHDGDGNGVAVRGNGGNGRASTAGKSNGSARRTNGKARAPRAVRAVPRPSA